MEKLFTSKTCLKMAGGKMHIPHPTTLDPFLAVNYRNHQKHLAYFSHLAQLILFFFTKKQSQKGAMAQWPPLNTLLLTTPKRARIAHRSLSRDRRINMQLNTVKKCHHNSGQCKGQSCIVFFLCKPAY